MNQINWPEKFTTFAIGVGVGALLALLFAPSSGKETRQSIDDTWKQCLYNATSKGKQWTRRVQANVDDVQANVAGAVEAGEAAYHAAMDA